MRIAFVVNPNARSVTAAVAERSIARWSAGHDVEVVRSAPTATAAVLGRGPLANAVSRAEAVVVLGGDGTVNDTVNAMVGSGSDATLVPLPAGTTNVVARTLGLPNALPAAEDRAMAALDAGRTMRRGIGTLNGVAFVANAGIGLDAGVVTRTEAHAHRKRRWGHAWFFTAALREGASRKGMRAVRLTVSSAGSGPAASSTGEVLSPLEVVEAVDALEATRTAETAPTAIPAIRTIRHGAAKGGEPAAPAFWVLALAAHPYTFVGTRPVELLAPQAPVEDGLAVLWFAPMRLDRLLRLTARSVLTSGGITSAREVVQVAVSSSLQVVSAFPTVWQTDGEARPPASSFTLRWQPDALRVVDLTPDRAAGADRRR